MTNPLFDMSPYQSQPRHNHRPDWTDTTGIDPAWDEPILETNRIGPDYEAPTEWRSAAEFTLTLPSGQHVDALFVPGLIGEGRMHQFDFRGSVSATGFKSHFVLAVEAEEFPHPHDYAQAYVEELITQMEKKHSSKGTKCSPVVALRPAPEDRTDDNDNSTPSNAMPETNAPELKNTPVEVVEELSPEELADRQRLELRVERAFYESGLALKELHSRRLYRNTHKSFEQYCFDRFGFQRRYPYYLIDAVAIVDNLCTNSAQILPNKETQVRPLTKLEPDEQFQVWQSAVEQAGGKVPPARIVKEAVLHYQGVVQRLEQKNPSPPEFALGDVVEIKATSHSSLRPFARMWGIIEHIGSFSYTVRLGIARDTQQCKGEEMTRIDDEYTADIKAVAGRISWLVQNFELEPIEYDILANLLRSKCFTPKQLMLLAFLEQQYGIV